MKNLNETLTSLFLEGPQIAEPSISKIRRSVVIAPHPDDESLACGGTIALLTKSHYRVHVIFITDGTMSHPNSKLFSTVKRRDLREAEAINALGILGVLPNCISFLRLPDSKLNKLSSTVYNMASETIKEIIMQVNPNTIFVPWRKDPHPDHMASWHLLRNAIKKIPFEEFNPPTLLEYLLWFWERTNPSEISPSKTVKIWRVNIKSTLSRKESAIREHVSQLGQLIKDDPEGFSLPPSLLKKMLDPEEVFLEYDDHFKKD